MKIATSQTLVKNNIYHRAINKTFETKRNFVCFSENFSDTVKYFSFQLLSSEGAFFRHFFFSFHFPSMTFLKNLIQWQRLSVKLSIGLFGCEPTLPSDGSVRNPRRDLFIVSLTLYRLSFLARSQPHGYC